MDYELNYAGADEFAAVAQLDGASFGFQYSETELRDAELDVELDTILVARDGRQIVGASAEVPFELTMPGGRQVDVTGLSWVSVEITHRRQGILRAMMEQQVRDRAARDVTAMVLTASEGGIYPRFGYGIATTVRKIAIDRRAALVAQPVSDHGVVRLLTDEARPLLPGLYDRWRRQTPGALDRNEKRWEWVMLDRDYQRHGMSALFHLVHADGYLSYRVRTGSNEVGVQNVGVVFDYAPCTPAAHAALWQVLLGMDLCARIESSRVPLDDPLPFLLADARQVTTTGLADGLWVRPLDVSALLSARRYAVDVDARLRVHDALLGDATYRLQGGPDDATCARTDADADIDLHVSDLGAISLGGSRLVPLLRAGRVRCADERLASRLDRAFLGDVAPQYGTGF
ncbi:MAG TPA: GNAT family N-acetyltransferase [Jatrophihabitantaceae bacterium]|nr:GNAT family N-acetyltransferase [Jatrophihabitantaceae bacterium]